MWFSRWSINVSATKVWLPIGARRALVNALIVPLSDYGAILHAGLWTVNKRRLKRIQNCSMRFVHLKSRRDSVSYLYTENNILQVSCRQEWLLLVLFYKAVVKGAGPLYISKKFKSQADVHTHSTRHSGPHFILPVHRTRSLTSTFHYQGAKLWNSLPNKIYLRDDGGYVSVGAFRARLRRHMQGASTWLAVCVV